MLTWRFACERAGRASARDASEPAAAARHRNCLRDGLPDSLMLMELFPAEACSASYIMVDLTFGKRSPHERSDMGGSGWTRISQSLSSGHASRGTRWLNAGYGATVRSYHENLSYGC